VVIGTVRNDWQANRFRTDLWLYRVDGHDGLVPLTQTGHEHSPKWSPDGRFIAFLSDRAQESAKDDDSDADSAKADHAEQIYIISLGGGEPYAVTSGDESIHSFDWAADSKSIYFATRQPRTKDEDAQWKKEWQDVIRFRESERGDAIFRVDVS